MAKSLPVCRENGITIKLSQVIKTLNFVCSHTLLPARFSLPFCQRERKGVKANGGDQCENTCKFSQRSNWKRRSEYNYRKRDEEKMGERETGRGKTVRNRCPTLISQVL